MPLLRGTNIQNGRVDLAELVFVDESRVNPVQHLRPDDIVMTTSSGSVALVGKAACMGQLDRTTTFGAFCAVIRVTDALPRWVYWATQSDEYRRHISAAAVGTNINNLKREDIGSFPIPIPPMDVQRRMVAQLEELLAEVDNAEVALERARVDLETWRKSLLKAAVTGELTADWRAANPPRETGADLLQRILHERRTRWLAEPRNKGKKYAEPAGPDTDGLPDLPVGWVWTTIGQLTSFVTSGSRGWADYYADAGSTFIRAQNIKTDKLVLDDVAFVSVPDTSEGVRTRVQQWDLLVTITGANVTKSAIVDDEINDAYVSQHVGLMRPVDPSIAWFIYWWLVTPAGGRAQLELAAYGAGKPGLNLPNLLGVFIPLPPKAEQLEINAELMRFLGEHSLLAEVCSGNSTGPVALRQSILAAAFRGTLTA